MNKRDVVRLAIEGRRVPYVPWHCGFTVEAGDKLRSHFGRDDLEHVLDNHFVKFGSDTGFFTDIGNNRFRDVFGVVWDRSGTPIELPALNGDNFVRAFAINNRGHIIGISGFTGVIWR